MADGKLLGENVTHDIPSTLLFPVPPPFKVLGADTPQYWHTHFKLRISLCMGLHRRASEPIVRILPGQECWPWGQAAGRDRRRPVRGPGGFLAAPWHRSLRADVPAVIAVGRMGCHLLQVRTCRAHLAAVQLYLAATSNPAGLNELCWAIASAILFAHKLSACA